MRLAVGFIALVLLACAIWSSHQHKPFLLLVDEAQATTIVCNPQPTPELIRWHKSKDIRT